MTDSRILQFLKEGTAPQHEAAERHFDLADRLRTPSTYAALLGRLYGFYGPLEAALARVPGYETVGLDFAARRKTPHLLADLAVLGRVPDDLPLATRLPPLTTLGEALGVMYVLEGATLGGRVISRLVANRLGFTAARAGAFFAGYGDRVGVMWSEFRAALVRFADTPAAEAEVVAAARGTFDSLNAWLATAPWVTT